MKYGHVLDSDEHSASAALEEAIIERRQSRGRRVRLIWRRTADFLGFSLFLVAMALVAVAGWAASANVAKSGWNSDAAAWVQAAGSIAAIAGAAWLAQSEARRTRKVRREHNEEAAWYVRFAVKQAQFESQIIASELVNRAFPVDKADVRQWRQRATTSAISLNALVGRTDHIHPSVTQVISNAKVLMDDLLGDLGELAAVVGDGSPPSDDLRAASSRRIGRFSICLISTTRACAAFVWRSMTEVTRCQSVHGQLGIQMWSRSPPIGNSQPATLTAAAAGQYRGVNTPCLQREGCR